MVVEFKFTKQDIGITEEEFNQLDTKSASSFMSPGVYDLEITEAAHHPNKDTGSVFSAKDPTWLVVKIVLSAGTKTKQHYLMVPTSKILFNEEGDNAKNATFAFRNFRDFMNSIGESVTADASVLKAIVPRLFADPKKLIGKKLKAEIGYKKNYIGYHKTPEGIVEFRLMKKDGTPLDPSVFATKDDAVAYAVANDIKGIDDKTFPEILKFFPQVKLAVKADTEEW